MKFLVILLLLISASIADATVWHVKLSGGTTGNCSTAVGSSDPGIYIRSIVTALGCMNPATAGSGGGHTVRIYTGVYAEAINNIIPGGTSWTNYFTIEKNPGDVVEIKPTSCSALIVIDVRRTNSRYFQIKGTSPTDRLKITAGNGTCNNDGIKFATSTSLGTPTFGRLMYLEVSNAINHGIQFTANSTNNEVKYSYIHSNGDQINVDDTHGAYIHSANNLFEGNIFESNCNRGLQIFNTSSNNAHNNIVRGNIFRFNGTCEPAAGVVLSSGNNIQFYGNFVYGNTSHGVSVSQNSPVGTLIYNNTIYNNDGSAINIISGVNTVIRNNIMRNNNATVTDTGSGTIQSNTLTSDPLFVNAAAGDLCVLTGSPAINAGVATIASGVTRVYNGSAPDIGACERFGHSSAVVH